MKKKNKANELSKHFYLQLDLCYKTFSSYSGRAFNENPYIAIEQLYKSDSLEKLIEWFNCLNNLISIAFKIKENDNKIYDILRQSIDSILLECDKKNFVAKCNFSSKPIVNTNNLEIYKKVFDKNKYNFLYTYLNKINE